jgi:hypothetical protein
LLLLVVAFGVVVVVVEVGKEKGLSFILPLAFEFRHALFWHA